jgi:hypothetical protein
MQNDERDFEQGDLAEILQERPTSPRPVLTLGKVDLQVVP